jgi:hypothetical protein
MKTRKAKLEFGVPPRCPWLLFDVSNGHDGVKNYVWWFTTESKAKGFKAQHERERRQGHNRTTLVGPYFYNLVPTASGALTRSKRWAVKFAFEVRGRVGEKIMKRAVNANDAKAVRKLAQIFSAATNCNSPKSIFRLFRIAEQIEATCGVVTK